MHLSEMTLHLTFGVADERHIAPLTALRVAAARVLAEQYGDGHWASEPSERAVRTSMRGARVLVVRRGARIVGTCRLSTRRPWAIDTTYFTPVDQPLYLTDMAVHPDYQRMGIGRALLDHARDVALAWPKGPVDAIRLDAYDAPAGAGGFYASYGYRETGRATYRGTPLAYYELLLRDENGVMREGDA